MDKSGVGGVALPLSVLESNTNQEHLSASVQRNQDKKEATKEKKWANVLGTNMQTENWTWVMAVQILLEGTTQWKSWCQSDNNQHYLESLLCCIHSPAESSRRGLIPRHYLSVEYEATAS